MTKKQKNILIAVAVMALLACGLWQVNKIEVYSSRHFLAHTVINGVDCSRMTVGEAKKTLTEKWNEQSFEVKKDGKVIAAIENLDFSYPVEQQLKDAMNQPIYKDLWRYITKKKETVTISMTAGDETQSFRRQINAMKFLDRKYKVKTKDAYVDLSNRNFNIIKEVQGDNIDKERFKEKVLKCIADGKFDLDYQPEECYALPKIHSTDKELLDYRDYCRKNLSQKITYRFYNGKRTLTPADLAPMIAVKDGKRQTNKTAVKKFVAKLAASHNTLGAARRFHAACGGTITVSGGSYGYLIDQNRERSALTRNLQNGRDVTRRPKYSQIPYFAGSGSSDIGSSYVEIDIARQHLWLYQNGSVLADSPVVTGNLSGGFATPKGVYYLVYKAQGVKLKGRNSDGSRYESPVEYWMPFYQDYGMHDASWRGDFGGSIYQNAGSHGCVNLPRSAAAAIYANITSGYPVVVH